MGARDLERFKAAVKQNSAGNGDSGNGESGGDREISLIDVLRGRLCRWCRKGFHRAVSRLCVATPAVLESGSNSYWLGTGTYAARCSTWAKAMVQLRNLKNDVLTLQGRERAAANGGE
ncbi:hypothetical protein MRX96_008383 [Rhipicephalus microplus]